MTRLTALAAAAALLLTADQAAAQPEAPMAVRMACMSSAQSLCANEIAARDKPAVRACLLKNLDKVSPGCREAIKSAQAQAH